MLVRRSVELIGSGNLNVLVTWQQRNEVAPMMWRLILLSVINVPSPQRQKAGLKGAFSTKSLSRSFGLMLYDDKKKKSKALWIT